jgi:Lipocalin-like domain
MVEREHTMATDDVGEKLVGTYRLLTMEDYADDGEVSRPFGDSPEGFITYTPEGYMLAILSRPDRAPFEGGDILGGSPEEQSAAFLSASSFAGRYEVRDNQVVHTLEAATFPNWKGTTQPRRFELTDTHLTLFPPKLLMHGKMRSSRVHFERIVARPGAR